MDMNTLPRSKTMPTGITDNVKDLLNPEALFQTIALMKRLRGAKAIGLTCLDAPVFDAPTWARLRAEGVCAVLWLGDDANRKPDGLPVDVFDRQTGATAVERCDLFVSYELSYWNVYQKIGVTPHLSRAVMAKDVPVVPYAANAWRYPLLPAEYLEGDPLADLKFNWPVWQYITRSNLRGSYAEFGTWYGRSFFRNYLYLNQEMDGDFWSFDSFGGLPPGRPNESLYTKGDFEAGRYFCNEGSLRAIGSMLFPEDHRMNDRVKLVKGYYSETLDGKTIADYGIKEKSISFCVIDCDLFDSTLSVLRFIEPALDEGSVLYFDDYRLARAAKEASEYHAVKVWLRENPTIDLLDLHRDFWPNQYVIFNRLW
jgi:Macrocin-O-methyltransferase (TylF)